MATFSDGDSGSVASASNDDSLLKPLVAFTLFSPWSLIGASLLLFESSSSLSSSSISSLADSSTIVNEFSRGNGNGGNGRSMLFSTFFRFSMSRNSVALTLVGNPFNVSDESRGGGNGGGTSSSLYEITGTSS